MKVLNEYPGSHHYWTSYEKCNLFCPNCGKQELWQDCGGGDYYAGSEYVCLACECSCYLDDAQTFPREEPNKKMQLAQIRSGTTAEPTTRKGG